MKTNNMKTKLVLYLAIGALVLLPSVALVLNDAYGYGGGNSALVRQDLPPRVKKFVKAHELYHCRDKATWGGWVGREIRANSMCGLKDPIGLIATAWKTLTDVDRIKFYMKRMKEGH